MAGCLLKPSLSRSPVHTACAGCKDSLAAPIKRSRQQLLTRQSLCACVLACGGRRCRTRVVRLSDSAGRRVETGTVVAAVLTPRCRFRCRGCCGRAHALQRLELLTKRTVLPGAIYHVSGPKMVVSTPVGAHVALCGGLEHRTARACRIPVQGGELLLNLKEEHAQALQVRWRRLSHTTERSQNAADAAQAATSGCQPLGASTTPRRPRLFRNSIYRLGHRFLPLATNFVSFGSSLTQQAPHS